MLVHCAECGHEVSDKAKVCPKCGAPIDGPTLMMRDNLNTAIGGAIFKSGGDPGRNILIYLALVAGVFIVLLIIVFLDVFLK